MMNLFLNRVPLIVLRLHPLVERVGRGCPVSAKNFSGKKIQPLPPGKNGWVGVAAANASTVIRPRLVSVFRRLVS